MKLKKAIIKDFKRFTNLTVQSIPETARLIILAGPNGCGKSSFFDALLAWQASQNKGYGLRHFQWDSEYHNKVGSGHTSHRTDGIKLDFFGSVPAESEKTIYIRSAYRNEHVIPRLHEDLPVTKMNNNDGAIYNNFLHLVGLSLDGIFASDDATVSLSTSKKKIFGDITNDLSELFSELKFDGIRPPLSGSMDIFGKDINFCFTKGMSKGFWHKNLSSGEKAAFDLILDLVIARRLYSDAIFCIDEPEMHMHARLQAKLLNVLYGLIPENCQLILATHSIGMMRRARDIEEAHPGKIVFLDFGGRDFDKEQVIEPAKLNRSFWKEAHQIAFDDLAALIAPKRVVACEGQPKTKKTKPTHSHDHDAQCYEGIFEAEFPETHFVSMGGAQQVIDGRDGLAQVLQSLVKGIEVIGLIDRDARSEQEASELRKSDIRILSRRNLEAYLFDDEVLRELAVSENKTNKIKRLLTEKQKILDKCVVRKDDLKPVSGKIYCACKEILSLTQCGNSPESFMRDTLVPLIKPGMGVYDELKRDIFGTEQERKLS